MGEEDFYHLKLMNNFLLAKRNHETCLYEQDVETIEVLGK